jgi:hypothetical protein
MMPVDRLIAEGRNKDIDLKDNYDYLPYRKEMDNDAQ